MFDPLDNVFGEKYVQHSFSIGGSMPLANLALKDKRMMYLDDFNMITYASTPGPPQKPTIPVAQQLNLFSGRHFEVTVSQSANNGSPDCCWRKGIVMTSKLEGLWTLAGAVTAEDVRHLQSRVLQFNAPNKVQGPLRATSRCAESFSTWLVRTASIAANALVATPANGSEGSGQASSSGGRVAGFREFCETVAIPQQLRAAFEDEIAELGAVRVDELSAEDWQGLGMWQQLRPLEQRRVLKHG